MIGVLGVGLVICRNFSGSLFLALPVMGLYTATIFEGLRANGSIAVPVIGWDAQLSFGVALHWIPSLLLSLAIAGALGAMVYRWIFYYLERLSPLVGTIAAMGLLLYVQALIQQLQRNGSGTYVESILAIKSVTMFGVTTTTDRASVAIVAVVLVVGLAVLYRKSSFGLASRAVASNPWGAQLVGLHRERFGALNWALAFTAAGVVMILATPFLGRDPGTILMLMIPALAAALVGKLQSLIWTLFGGLVIGGLQSVAVSVDLNLGSIDLSQWVSPAALQQVVPIVVAIGAFILMRGSLIQPEEGSSALAMSPSGVPSRLNSLPKPTPIWQMAVSAVLGMVVLSTLFLNSSVQFHRSVLTTLIMALLALATVAWSGSTGIPTAAPVAIAGSAAAVWSASLAAELPTILAVGLAMGVAVAFGVGGAVMAHKVRGMWYLVVTLLVVTAVSGVVLASPKVLQHGSGATTRELSALGINFSAWDVTSGRLRPMFVMIIGAVFVMFSLVVAFLWRGRSGLEFRVFQGNERVAIATGLNPWRLLLKASLVSSLIAAVAGIALAMSVPSISALSFIAPVALSVLVLTQLGGVARVSSAVLAGVIAPAGALAYTAEKVTSQPFETVSLGVGGLGVVVLLVIQARRTVDVRLPVAALGTGDKIQFRHGAIEGPTGIRT